MALDNAQFISQLSITDPPGTDAVAEGDDHIRTVKRATQQSFPNIDAAVPQTAAQMGQMAIKNEVNVFTLANTFEGDLTAASSVFNAMARVGGGGQSDIRYLNQSGLQRWVLRVESDVAGNDWTIHRRDALGDPIDVPIRVDAGNGAVTFDATTDFKKKMTVTFGQMQIRQASIEVTDLQFAQSSGNTRWIWRMDSDLNGNSMLLNRRDAAGVSLDNVMEVFASGSVLYRTAFLVIQRPDAVSSTQLVFQNETTNRWFWRFSVANGRLEMVRLNSSGNEQDSPLACRASDGVLIMATLPTSDPGVSGGLFLSSGFVAVSP